MHTRNKGGRTERSEGSRRPRRRTNDRNDNSQSGERKSSRNYHAARSRNRKTEDDHHRPERKKRSFSGRRSGGNSRFGDEKKSYRKSSSFGHRKRGNKRKKKFSGDNIPVEKFINRNPKSVQEKPVPITHVFEDFGFHKDLQYNVARRGFTTPTPIQDQTIPHTMQGRDLIGLANTGTGKTAAFLLPLIHRTMNNMDHTTIILAPTRELAVQINDELRKLVLKTKVFSTVCVGGTRIQPQIKALRRTNHFIVGTPGRIIDLIKQRALKIQNINTIVLDEADRMLDMGFIDDMRFIMNAMPEGRNTLFFSATMSDQIKGLVHEFLTDPVEVSVITSRTSKNIAQDIVPIQGRDKVEVLAGLLKDNDFSKVLVFCRTRRGSDTLTRQLRNNKISAEVIHGMRSHHQRRRSLDAFKEGRAQVLVATDVAARGIHVSKVSHVINFDIPATYDDYVHRIGRTGRGNHEGKALTFVR